MKIDVVMPKMGESLQEGTIIKWFKKEGDKIERDEMILEISTDKVDTEVPSPSEGILSKILFGENETVEVGLVIAYIETDASAMEPKAEAPKNEEPKVEAPKNEAPTSKSQPKDNKNENKQEDNDAGKNEDNAGSGENLIDVVMPKMGESLQEGTIIKWFKKEGEKVERDEMILEISTDKVDTEVPSPVGGTLAKIIVAEGTTVEVGAVIAQISTGEAKPKSTQNVVPEIDPKAKQGQMENKTENNGNVAEDKPKAQAAKGTIFDIPARKDDKFFSPLVREISKQNKISLEELMSLTGTGADSRLTKDDLMKYIDLGDRQDAPARQEQQSKPAPQTQQASKPAQASQSQPQQADKPAAKAPTYTFGEDTEVIPMGRVRQLISDHMVYSKRTSAHVTSVGEADVTGIVRMRDKIKKEFEKREGLKLTYTPFFAHAAISAIKKFPMVNVSVDGKNILLHHKINLSFATALDDGNLIVPVIKNSDSLNITGLQKSVTDLATRARNKKLLPEEIQGGTFTITNVGTFGTLFGTPVINQPQAAIMGIGAIKKRPVVKEVDGEYVVVIRDMVYVSITYDHRVIDGMLAGQWLAEAISVLENINEKTTAI